ncbi:DUF4175 family protein [Muricoccus radiodurans]|uniref:DUF4175 domain-containing protein n=1 Tax=Muricoccus radiodurans TaxID=2231721 RepID=UPI003CF2C4CE
MTARPGGPHHPALRRLSSLRARARLALLWESLWPRAWPVLGVLGVFLVLALSGLFLRLPVAAHLALLAALLAALGWTLWRGSRGLVMPGDTAADRRLERDSGLPHRPLTTLLDHPAGDDPAAEALWRVHQQREAARIARLRTALPRPGLPAHDPKALRLGLVVAVLASFVMAGGEAPERLRRALWPEFRAAAAPTPTVRIEAWVTPPAYTGAAPVFLDPAGGSATVPAGSRLRIALSGGLGRPELLRDGAEAAPFQPLGAGSHLSETALDAGGRLVVRQSGLEVVGWTLAVQADAPPRILFPEPPAPAQRGLATRLPWRAEDDWGIASARAELRLEARPDAPPLVVELSVPPGHPKTPRGVAQPDLSAHPWAGLPVRARLFARDGAEQEGSSEEAALTLPERTFNHPVARGLILLRKGLSVAPDQRQAAINGLERLAEAPEAFENDAGTFLALRTSRTRLSDDQRPEAVGEVQQILWEAALALEEGRADRTARALAQAREALREALRERRETEAREQSERRQAERERAERDRDARAQEQRDREREARNQEAQQRGEPRDETQERADRERSQQERAERQEAERQAQTGERERQEERNSQRAETDRRIQELRDAIRRHLEALAEQLQRENGETQQDPQLGQQQRRETDRRTSRMREQNRQDRPEEAERELAELERMLEQLENGEMAQAGREQQRQRRERGQQQMGVIQDMVRRQSRLLDGAHSRAQDDESRRARERRQSFNYPNRWPPQPPPTSQPPAETRQEEARDARTQRALRRALGELMQQQGDLTGEVPAPLGRADQAMRQGAEALTGGGDPRPHQERAIRELSEGGRQMAQRMARQFGQQQPGEGEDAGEGEGQGDAMAEGGMDGGEGEDQMAQQGEGRDPLGRRPREANGTNEDGGDTRVPDEAEMLRTRRIQEELRRRGAERERPPAELDYIDRLLRRF